MGQVIKMWIRLNEQGFWAEQREQRGREGAKRERKKENPTFFPQSTEFHQLEFIGLITKVHILDEGYAWVPKMKDFTEDPKKEIWGNQIFRA